MGADSDLEYFPDDGYDYEQHLAPPDWQPTGGVYNGFLIEADNLKAKRENPVFTGQLERAIEEMAPEEREILAKMDSDSDESEFSDEEDDAELFLDQIIPKGKEANDLISDILWRESVAEKEVLMPTSSRLTTSALRGLRETWDTPFDEGPEFGDFNSESSDEMEDDKRLDVSEAALQAALRDMSDEDSLDDYDDDDGSDVERLNQFTAQMDPFEVEANLPVREIGEDLKTIIKQLMEQQTDESGLTGESGSEDHDTEEEVFNLVPPPAYKKPAKEKPKLLNLDIFKY